MLLPTAADSADILPAATMFQLWAMVALASAASRACRAIDASADALERVARYDSGEIRHSCQLPVLADETGKIPLRFSLCFQPNDDSLFV